MTRDTKVRTGVSLDRDTVEKIDIVSTHQGSVFMRRSRSDIINLLLHCYFNAKEMPPLPDFEEIHRLQTAEG